MARIKKEKGDDVLSTQTDEEKAAAAEEAAKEGEDAAGAPDVGSPTASNVDPEGDGNILGDSDGDADDTGDGDTGDVDDSDDADDTEDDDDESASVGIGAVITPAADRDDTMDNLNSGISADTNDEEKADAMHEADLAAKEDRDDLQDANDYMLDVPVIRELKAAIKYLAGVTCSAEEFNEFKQSFPNMF